VEKHPDSFVTAGDLGSRFPPYKPNFPFPGEYIDQFHTLIGSSAKSEGLINPNELLGVPITGWLRRADALKLYELGYFVAGDILELGSYHGLSTCILSQSNYNSGARKQIFSIDLSSGNCAKTIESLQITGLRRNVETRCADATSAVERLAMDGARFQFVFIDHSHSYEPVYEICQLLPKIVTPGGWCLFHDFNDRRNQDPTADHGVYRAVIDGLDADLFEFYGIYGCTALYRMGG